MGEREEERESEGRGRGAGEGRGREGGEETRGRAEKVAVIERGAG